MEECVVARSSRILWGQDALINLVAAVTAVNMGVSLLCDVVVVSLPR